MNVIRLNSLSADISNTDEIRMYTASNEAQLLHYYEPKEGVFIAESPKVIARAVAAGYKPISMLMEERMLQGACDEGNGQEPANGSDNNSRGYICDEGDKSILADIFSRVGDIPIYTAPFEEITKLTGFELTRGALAAMRRKKLPSAGEICSNADRVVLMDGVVNPTNVGAVMRSAAALGMDAVLLTEDSADPLYRRAIRVSMGTVFQIPWTIIGCDDKIGCLKELGFTTVAMALRQDSIGIDDRRLKEAGKLAVIMGTEGEGLAQEVIDECDYTAMIPMANGVDSLNVAAASAVIFWELRRLAE
ncbi:MAG: RNA methyltransferase [Lachnospiraceae bacterium]|nr:RNA methyltransferase [Lachnospiraceae bacterium]